MLRHLGRLLPILMAIALAAAALPASAAGVPVNPHQSDLGPNPPVSKDEVCVPIGLALAVISRDGTVADILPAPADPNQPDPGPGAGRTIVLRHPAAVGACAEFNGFWGPGVTGTAASTLVLYQRMLDSAADTLQPVARDGLSETRRGPAVHHAALKAAIKLAKPGKYHFLAHLTVSATQPTSAGAAAQPVEEELRVPFSVEVLDEPDGPPLGALEGIVRASSPDGGTTPLAGATVMAMPYAESVRAKVSGAGNPIVVPNPPAGGSVFLDTGSRAAGSSPTSLKDAAAATRLLQADALGDQQRGPWAKTDADGRYRIELPRGRYVVVALAGGFTPQFYDHQARLEDATKVDVVASETRAGVDFDLHATSAPAPPQPPEPPATGLISGNVHAGDQPLANAVVRATPARSGGPLSLGALVPLISAAPLPLSALVPPMSGGLHASGAPVPPVPLGGAAGAVTRTDENGDYLLELPEGDWIVMAHAEGYKPQWFNGADELVDADPVTVDKDVAAEGVDFDLVAVPGAPQPPEPRGHAKLMGTVIQAGGPPIPGAIVMAAPPGPAPMPLGGELAPESLQGPRVITRTDRNGQYVLAVPAGTWIVHAIADGFEPQWYDGAAAPEGATPLQVEADQGYRGIDFALVDKLGPTIAGRVTIAGTDLGVAGIVVIAAIHPDDMKDPSADIIVVAQTMTDANGEYTLYVPPGKYAVGAMMPNASGRALGKQVWWDRRDKFKDADPVIVGDSDDTMHVTGIDFVLRPSTVP